MATEKQKAAARRNLEKARATPRDGRKASRHSPGMSTAEQNRLPHESFAFPEERKEPLVDAAHVRNAVARFDQVEGVTDAERDRAWRRIQQAAGRFDVHLSASDWRELRHGGRSKNAS